MDKLGYLNTYIDDSDFINEYLRRKSVKKDIDMELDVKNIVSLMNYPNEDDRSRLYFRGIKVNRKKLKVGTIFVNKGFTSCTTNVDIALDFSDRCCLFVFNIPKKLKMYKIPNSQEDEILLQPDIKFKITQISKNQHMFMDVFENIIYVKISKSKAGDIDSDCIYM